MAPLVGGHSLRWVLGEAEKSDPRKGFKSCRLSMWLYSSRTFCGLEGRDDWSRNRVFERVWHSWSEFEWPHSCSVECTTTEEVAGFQMCCSWWKKGGACTKVGIFCCWTSSTDLVQWQRSLWFMYYWINNCDFCNIIYMYIVLVMIVLNFGINYTINKLLKNIKNQWSVIHTAKYFYIVLYLEYQWWSSIGQHTTNINNLI